MDKSFSIKPLAVFEGWLVATNRTIIWKVNDLENKKQNKLFKDHEGSFYAENKETSCY